MKRLISLTGIEGFRPRLEHIKAFLADSIERIESHGTKVVVIGGTNGKGGTTHALKYLLETYAPSAGAEKTQKISCWTSPHVLTILERLTINSAPMSYDRLDMLLDEYENFIKEEGLSFYEALFYLFIKEVSRELPDYLLLEVGLGGRFDAVNIFSKPLCALTSISLDHTEILGETLKEILFEKYGITRSSGELISAVEQKHLQQILATWCERDEIELTQLELSQALSYEQRNRELAKRLFVTLCHREVDDNPHWPQTKGRREKVTFRERDFIFIGAHNLDGHRKMLKMLKEEAVVSNDDLLVVSFSSGREKQIESILSLYSKYPCLFSQRWLSSFQGPRAISKDDLKKYENDDFSYLDDWNYLLDDKYKNKKIIITGSYFFISEVQKHFHMFD